MPTMKKKLYLQHTKVLPHKTAGEIVSVLVAAGARDILHRYDDRGQLVGIRFALEPKKLRQQIYALPARIDAVYRILREQRSYTYNEQDLHQQAERIAWRLLLAWVKAQLALIEVGMVEAEEVFLPYCEGKDGRTFYEIVQAGGQLALPPADSKIVEFQKG